MICHRRFINSAYRRVVGKHDGHGHTEHALAHHDVAHSVVHVVWYTKKITAQAFGFAAKIRLGVKSRLRECCRQN